MAKKVNLPLDKLVVRRDFHSHVALEFYRGDKWSEYLAFDPSGLQKFRESIAKFEKQYDTIIETPLERVALTFLRSLKGAYLPGDGVAEIILEIFTMAATNNNDLTALDTKALVEVYNKLAVATGKPELKSFKESKSKLIARIEALKEEAAKPTVKQALAKAASAAKAEKRLEGLKETAKARTNNTKPITTMKAVQSERTTPVAKATPKGKAKPSQNESKAADKPKMTSAEAAKKGSDAGKAKSPGIGAFCMGLIRAGKTNAEVLAAAQKQFPGAKTSASSVAWYRNKLKSDGEIAN